jgi:small subunit ribosomal protein S1
MPNAAAPSKKSIADAIWPPFVPRHFRAPDTPLIDNLITSARRYPDKTALVFLQREISYAQLLHQVERMAAFLQQRGVKRGDRVKGPIKSITDFGVFLGLASGIDGLVHLSDLSWTEPGEAAVRNFKKGQEVEAVVLAIDVERERISLGIKQLDDDSFTTFTSVNDKGQIVTGKVKSVDAKGAEIDLGDELTGYLRASEISADRVEDARTMLKEGDEVTAVVLNVDRKSRSIQLSIRAKDAADQQEAMSTLNQQAANSAGTTSLGALLRAKLDNGDSNS